MICITPLYNVHQMTSNRQKFIGIHFVVYKQNGGLCTDPKKRDFKVLANIKRMTYRGGDSRDY